MVITFKQHCNNPNYISDIEKRIKDDRSARDRCEIMTYKTVGDINLDAFVYKPEDLQPGEKRPAFAFFHGGGWECGKPEWGQWQCEHYASKGLVAVSFEYRLTSQHDATPIESIADAKSAIRWMRIHVDELGIDPDKIAVSGFSAGGHLALCTALIDKFDEPGEDSDISSAANAFILWSSASKLEDNEYFKGIIKGRADIKDCDPAMHIRPNLPPAIIFHGSEDKMVPVQLAKEFARSMRLKSNRCDIHIYDGQTHLNWGKSNRDVMNKMDQFLASINMLWEQNK
jgi:acetyl esterase/lipase